MNTGSGQVGVAMLSVRVSVNLGKRKRETVDHISYQLVFERNARILSSFSCTEAGFHVQFLTSCSFAVEDSKNIYDLGA